KGIKNDIPMQGPYHVNKEGSGDMYVKGGVFWNMVRTMIDDDVKWRYILRSLNRDFHHKQVDYNDILQYISKHAALDLTKVFEQYIQHTSIPTLQVKFDQEGHAYARWKTEVSDFNMPVHLGRSEEHTSELQSR